MEDVVDTVSHFSETSVLIIVVGMILVISLLILAMARGWISPKIGKDGIVFTREPDLGSIIPNIDQKFKSRCGEILSGKKERVITRLPHDKLTKIQRILLDSKIREPLYERIKKNHLASRLSSREAVREWKEQATDLIQTKVEWVIDFLGNDAEKSIDDYVAGPEFKGVIGCFLDDLIDDFQDEIINTSKEKIDVYERIKDAVRKGELIKKNEKYIMGIESMRDK
jgi:hypothetical protein